MVNYDVLDELGTLNEQTGQDMGPYHWGTLYDMLGYSASGSLIDYYNTARRFERLGFRDRAHRRHRSQHACSPGLMNQVWVDSIRAINFTMFQQAVEPKRFTYKVGGRAAYVFDPEVVTDSRRPRLLRRQGGAEGRATPYRVTRMRFFEDLNRYASANCEAARAADR